MIYRYKAKNEDGRTVRGEAEAKTVAEFYEILDRKQLLCIGYEEVKKTGERALYRLRSKDLTLFCKKVSTMLSAGMSITGCLEVMYSTETKPKLKQVYMDLYESVKGGKALSESMRCANGAFPMLLINMMESGEESGNVDMMMDKLAEYFARQAKISGKIKTATMYPKLLAVVAVLVIIILFTAVLPKIFETFADAELPAITRFMMNLSNALVEYWYILLIVAAALVIFVKIGLQMPKLQLYNDRISINMPLVGPLMKKIYSARFASTLAILYSSGISLLNGIGLSMNVMGNSYIEASLSQVVEKVSVGQSLSAAIAQENVFDGLLSSMIKIGEETGSLGSILESVSTYYEAETENAIESLLAILEPLLLIVMALIIGTVLVSVMLPIYGMYSQIG